MWFPTNLPARSRVENLRYFDSNSIMTWENPIVGNDCPTSQATTNEPIGQKWDLCATGNSYKI